MLVGALTFPLIGDNGIATWANQLGSGTLEHTVLTVLGVHDGWLAVAPVLAAVAVAIAFAALATPRSGSGTCARPCRAARMGGGLVLGPSVAGDPVTPLGDGPAALTLVALAVAASLTALLALRWRSAAPTARPSAWCAPGVPGRRADLVDDQVADPGGSPARPRDRAPRRALPRRALDPVGVQDHAAHPQPRQQRTVRRSGNGSHPLDQCSVKAG